MSDQDGQPGLNAAIARAKRQRDQCKAQAPEHMRRPSYLLSSPDKLIALAEYTKALNIYGLEALVVSRKVV
jgi:hypothetical protein